MSADEWDRVKMYILSKCVFCPYLFMENAGKRLLPLCCELKGWQKTIHPISPHALSDQTWPAGPWPVLRLTCDCRVTFLGQDMYFGRRAIWPGYIKNMKDSIISNLIRMMAGWHIVEMSWWSACLARSKEQDPSSSTLPLVAEVCPQCWWEFSNWHRFFDLAVDLTSPLFLWRSFLKFSLNDVATLWKP